MKERPLTLLMIDDSDASLDIIESLVNENFPDALVFRANNGKNGLQLAASEDPDVILLDILMPVMDGFEVCKRLKADDVLKEIPVVFITVLIDTAERIKALDAGAEGFLNKPVDEAELVAQIRAMAKIKSVNRQKRDEADLLKQMVHERTTELNQKIEQYKTAQDDLKASEEKFSKVFYSNPYMLTITRASDGKILDVNDTFCQVSGCTREEVLGSSTPELKIWVNPQDRDLLVSALRDGRKVEKWQFPFRKKNGDVITGLISSQLLNVSGEPCIVSYIEDVTEQKKTEEELNEMNARFFAFTENLPVTMFIKNKEQKVLYVNKEMKRVFGDNDWTGKTVYDIFPHKTAEKLIEADNRSFEKGYNVSTHVLPDKQGAERAWETHIFRIERTERKPLIGGFSLDITDRIKMEHALLQSEENLRNFFNTSVDFLWVMSYKAEIIAVNNTVINRLGYSQKELVGQKVEMLHNPQYFAEGRIIKNEIIQGRRDDCPFPLQTKTGEQIPVETRFFRGVWNGKQCFYGISRDISKLKLSEEKFSKAFHTSPNIVGLSDIETGEYVEVNKVFYDKLEYTPEEIFGAKIKNLIRMDEGFRNRTINKLIANGFVRNEETVIYSKSGKPLNVLMSADIIRIGSKNYNFTTAVDITEIRKAEAELKYYARLLEIITGIATKYINLPISNMDEGLNSALRDVGRFVKADRAYIFEYNFVDKTTTCTHEWCNDSVEPQIKYFQNKPIDELEDYVFHRNGNVFYVHDSEKVVDEKFRSFLLSMGIKSIRGK
jgi:PAS domain S-box-containing protein